MAGVRAMWEAEYGPGTVVGLAPSAQVLAADLGIVADNTAQWAAQQRRQPDREQRITTIARHRDRAIRGSHDTTRLDAHPLSKAGPSWKPSTAATEPKVPR